ncbi:DUF3043 domain-containing protein [Bifidobacterium indicum]|uniref:DUF3043 domain-containing protein n=1 Tax=Bifidobacterium indicum TaxID=1691 RepID=UPI002632C044|nr:DUF3043 domain-containing protein [uncultured Bifidobacterium sp.]
MTWNPFTGKDKKAQGQESDTGETRDRTEGKGRPTPKRKVAEAQTLRPLVPKDRKASRKAAKARIRAREDAQYEAMKTGDVVHMPKAERLPWRVYIRDYVDARFNLLEWSFPAIMVLIVGMFISLFTSSVTSPATATTINLIVTIAIYVYIIIGILDTWLMWRRLKTKLIGKFGERSVARGSRSASYAWQRAMMVRRWRVPKPTSPKRGNWPK